MEDRRGKKETRRKGERMKAFTKTSVCPFCKKETTVGYIETPKITICICEGCHVCWEILEGKVDRLTRLKEVPETDNEHALCPICWREMKADYKRWYLVCPDPICGYEKKLPGISIEQAKVRKEYIGIREEVFTLANTGAEIPLDKQSRLKELREQYIVFSKNDPDRL